MSVRPLSYIVTCDGRKYKYALHSRKGDRAIFPSQVLNLLEYCLFKKVKSGWDDGVNPETFPFNVELFQDGNIIDEWEDKQKFMDATYVLLQQYYKNIPREQFANTEEN